MKCGGCYIYNNLRGCDGQRVYFEGVSTIALNGDVLTKAKQFALQEVVSNIEGECVRTFLIRCCQILGVQL